LKCEQPTAPIARQKRDSAGFEAWRPDGNAVQNEGVRRQSAPHVFHEIGAISQTDFFGIVERQAMAQVPDRDP
jgi:hypothetical protein